MASDAFHGRRANLSPGGEGCATCKFFRPHRPGDKHSLGDCRRRAPAKRLPRWPEVDPLYGWCGQFERDPTAQDGWTTTMSFGELQAEIAKASSN